MSFVKNNTNVVKTCSNHTQFITNQRKHSRQETTEVEVFPKHFHCSITNLCLELTLAPCSWRATTQIAKKPKLGQQETIISSANKMGKKGLDCSSGRDDPWKIKKTLETSDVGNNSRLLLSRELSKKFVVPVVCGGAQAASTKGGVKVEIWDVDTNSLHSLFFKIQPSNKSHVFKGTWIKDFVNRRDLKIGDQIGFKWNPQNKIFDFSVLIRANTEQPKFNDSVLEV